MSEQDSNAAATDKKSTKKVGLILLLVILAAAVGIYMYQQRSMSIDGWSEDLDAAMVQAKQEKRPVVVFFVSNTPGPIARHIKNKVITKPGNKKALQEGKFVKVLVSVDSGLKCEVARKYKLTDLPTLIAFGPLGNEYNRLEGANAKNEVGFRNEVLKPKK
ncbi:MAG: thioredoxin family protein [Phycisphaerae bacterium]|nr:thioredoxin family protein [Phycisphaerae bacterium]